MCCLVSMLLKRETAGALLCERGTKMCEKGVREMMGPSDWPNRLGRLAQTTDDPAETAHSDFFVSPSLIFLPAVSAD